MFLGYSGHHKGYKCWYPTTGHIFISHNVIFDEATFSFKDLTSLHSPTTQVYCIITTYEHTSNIYFPPRHEIDTNKPSPTTSSNILNQPITNPTAPTTNAQPSNTSHSLISLSIDPQTSNSIHSPTPTSPTITTSSHN